MDERSGVPGLDHNFADGSRPELQHRAVAVQAMGSVPKTA
jgi:hypothetical protein